MTKCSITVLRLLTGENKLLLLLTEGTEERVINNKTTKSTTLAHRKFPSNGKLSENAEREGRYMRMENRQES